VLLHAVGEEGFVDLVVAEEGFFLSLSFLSHGEPDVGIDDIGVFCGFGRVSGEGDIGRSETIHEVLRWHAGFRGGNDALPSAEFFAHGEKVGEDLARMLFIGESIE